MSIDTQYKYGCKSGLFGVVSQNRQVVAQTAAEAYTENRVSRPQLKRLAYETSMSVYETELLKLYTKAQGRFFNACVLANQFLDNFTVPQIDESSTCQNVSECYIALTLLSIYRRELKGRPTALCVVERVFNEVIDDLLPRFRFVTVGKPNPVKVHRRNVRSVVEASKHHGLLCDRRSFIW